MVPRRASSADMVDEPVVEDFSPPLESPSPLCASARVLPRRRARVVTERWAPASALGCRGSLEEGKERVTARTPQRGTQRTRGGGQLPSTLGRGTMHAILRLLPRP